MEEVTVEDLPATGAAPLLSPAAAKTAMEAAQVSQTLMLPRESGSGRMSKTNGSGKKRKTRLPLELLRRLPREVEAFQTMAVRTAGG